MMDPGEVVVASELFLGTLFLGSIWLVKKIIQMDTKENEAERKHEKALEAQEMKRAQGESSPADMEQIRHQFNERRCVIETMLQSVKDRIAGQSVSETVQRHRQELEQALADLDREELQAIATAQS